MTEASILAMIYMFTILVANKYFMNTCKVVYRYPYSYWHDNSCEKATSKYRQECRDTQDTEHRLQQAIKGGLWPVVVIVVLWDVFLRKPVLYLCFLVVNMATSVAATLSRTKLK